MPVAVSAADFSDPTWPCIQRKVGKLSVGLMWPNPIEEITPERALADAVNDLVDRLTLRRIEVADLAPAVEEFAEATGRDPALLGHVFSEVFDRLASDRRAIMQGIEGFSLKQISLSERVNAARNAFEAEAALEKPDYDKLDKLEEQIDWDERIFIDRQRSLTYVCETPVLLEKRLYAIAQLLAAAADG